MYAHVSEAGLFTIVPHSLLNFFDMAKVQARPLLPSDARHRLDSPAINPRLRPLPRRCGRLRAASSCKSDSISRWRECLAVICRSYQLISPKRLDRHLS